MTPEKSSRTKTTVWINLLGLQRYGETQQLTEGGGDCDKYDEVYRGCLFNVFQIQIQHYLFFVSWQRRRRRRGASVSAEHGRARRQDVAARRRKGMSSHMHFKTLNCDLIPPPPTMYSGRTEDQKERRQPQRGIRTALATRRGCEAQERYVLAYPLLNSDRIPSQDKGALQDHGPGCGKVPAAGKACLRVSFLKLCSNPYPPLPSQDRALQDQGRVGGRCPAAAVICECGNAASSTGSRPQGVTAMST